MPKTIEHDKTCPICNTKTKVNDRAWYYTCMGCGSGINLIGIWWKRKNAKNWNELTQEMKQNAGQEYYEERKNWKKEIIEI